MSGVCDPELSPAEAARSALEWADDPRRNPAAVEPPRLRRHTLVADPSLVHGPRVEGEVAADCPVARIWLGVGPGSVRDHTAWKGHRPVARFALELSGARGHRVQARRLPVTASPRGQKGTPVRRPYSYASGLSSQALEISRDCRSGLLEREEMRRAGDAWIVVA